MLDRRRILALYDRGHASVLVTLIRIEGSSYRRAGARLLIAEDGSYAGAISGGCLEAEVIRKAQWLVRNGPVVERYSTLFDDTADIPYGLGCGGAVDLLFEPADSPECAALMEAFRATLRGELRHVTTHVATSPDGLRRSILGATGNELFTSEAALDPVIATFTETLYPPQRLFIFGAGDDAQPMAALAANLGWRVFVVDSRSQWARAERFPQAEGVLTDPAAPIADLGSSDAVILMTHSYEQDRTALLTTLPAQPRYLGLLGARHRSALLLHEAAEALDLSLADVCHRVFAPLGLDLGGDGAESIALATIAEIHAVAEGKQDTTARHMTPARVAELLASSDKTYYSEAHCAL